MENKNKNLEIEIRGPLIKPFLYKDLVKTITKQYRTNVHEKRQVIIFYKNNNRDFRIKWDKDKKYFEFVYKTKKGIQRTIREESQIMIDKKQLYDFLKIIEEFGLKNGFISPTYRIDIPTNLVIWSFKLGSVIGDYWEIEATNTLTKKFEKNKLKIKKYLLGVAKSYGLQAWSEEKFRKIRKEKWSKIKSINNSKIMKILQNESY